MYFARALKLFYMPLIFQQQINECTKIGVWHITETEDFFAVPLSRDITNQHKRLQHLAGRYLLRRLFPEFPLNLVLIADTRKPFLANEAFHFSISHCGDFAAAIASTKHRVGADIEIPHPKVERVKHKFLSAAEQELLIKQAGDTHQLLTMAWSIKEAVFKWEGAGQMDFIKHIEIIGLSKTHEGLSAQCLFKKARQIALEVHSMMLGENNLSWLVTE